MGSDHYINRTFPETLYNILYLSRCPETGDHLHAHRIVTHSFTEGVEVLFRKYGSRNQICNLLIFLNRFKSSSYRNFSLAEAHVTANKAVHDLRTFHIFLYGIYGTYLIICLLIRKHLFEFLLPYGICAVSVSRLLHPYCIEIYQILGDIIYRFPGFCFGMIPFIGTKLIELWRSGFFIRI